MRFSIIIKSKKFIEFNFETILKYECKSDRNYFGYLAINPYKNYPF